MALIQGMIINHTSSQASQHRIITRTTYSDNKNTESFHHTYTSSPYIDRKPVPLSVFSSSALQMVMIQLALSALILVLVLELQLEMVGDLEYKSTVVLADRAEALVCLASDSVTV